MKKIVSILLLSFFMLNINAQSDFLTQQKTHTRVQSAINDKEQLILKNLEDRSIQLGELNILMVAYKYESELEIYGKKNSDATYQKIVTYSICKKSGELGPKRKQGDRQVPEGFYVIDRFNPESSYHLSLGINYPNLSDKRKSNAARLGGDIFIHGDCVTIGCLPMTDDKMKEIYLYGINAKCNDQENIPVYIFPFKMTDQNYNAFRKEYVSNTELLGFWKNLKQGYNRFDNEKKELVFSINETGDYIFE